MKLTTFFAAAAVSAVLASRIGHASARLYPTASLSICTPQKAALGIGLTNTGWMSCLDVDTGWLFTLEPGLSGGSLNMGLRSGVSFFFIPLARIDVAASAMYTWNQPWGGLQDDQTYLGLRTSTWLPLLNVSVGLLRHVAGRDEDHDWVVTAGIGIGI